MLQAQIGRQACRYFWTKINLRTWCLNIILCTKFDDSRFNCFLPIAQKDSYTVTLLSLLYSYIQTDGHYIPVLTITAAQQTDGNEYVRS